MAVAGSGGEDSDFNVEVAKQFAREKNLQLMTCQADDSIKVQEVFHTIVAKIMNCLESDNMAGGVSFSVSLFNHSTIFLKSLGFVIHDLDYW